MTVVAAAYDGKTTYIGCDTLMSDGNVSINTATKLKKFDGFVVGYAGDPSAYVALNVLEPTEVEPTIASVYSEFLKPFARLVKKITKSKETDWSLLLAHSSGSIFELDSEGMIIECSGYGAIGSGSSHALSVMSVLNGPSRSQVKCAIEAAIAHCPTCGGNPIVEKVTCRR